MEKSAGVRASPLHVCLACLVAVTLLLLARTHTSRSGMSARRQECSQAPAPAHEQVQGSILTPAFLDCMVDVGKNLPIDGSGNFRAHQGVAGRKWNGDIRLEPFDPPLQAGAIIVEVGGHRDAADSRAFRAQYPAAFLHILEPVPPFFAELAGKWADQKNVKLHMEGLGMEDRVVHMPAALLDGEGTFVMTAESGSANGTLTLLIRDAAAKLQEIMTAHKKEFLEVLHVNCEGCEWEMFQRLGETGMFRRFLTIQISFHNYGDPALGIGALLPQYCTIREAMERTHNRIEAIPFAWERWVLKPDLRKSLLESTSVNPGSRSQLRRQ